ncbi:hypothetical protein DPMN_137279, partial [Dreissena polymorpha]
MERTVKTPAYGVPSYLPVSTGRLCVRSVGQNREHSVFAGYNFNCFLGLRVTQSASPPLGLFVR